MLSLFICILVEFYYVWEVGIYIYLYDVKYNS